MDLNQIFLEKQAELRRAQEWARVLQREIATIQATLEIVKRGPNGALPAVIGAQGALSMVHLSAAAQGGAHEERKRNPKGLVESLVIGALLAGAEGLDEIEKLVNEGAQFPITRGALRTLLMNMKNDEKVVSDKPGTYRLPTKGDALTAGQSGKGVNVQPDSSEEL